MKSENGDRAPEEKTWLKQLPAIALGAAATLVITITIGFGNRVVATGDSSIVLTARVEQLIKVIDGQDKKNDDQSKSIAEVLIKVSTLYTRDEARADREASERRFQTLEIRLADVGRRIESIESRIQSVEANQRFWQQVLGEKQGQRRSP